METLLYRLNRSVQRLTEFCRLGAPSIIKKMELAIIADICSEMNNYVD